METETKETKKKAPAIEGVATHGSGAKPKIRSFQTMETCELANGRRTFQQNNLTDLELLPIGIKVTTKTGQLGKQVLNQLIIPFANVKAILLYVDEAKC